MMLDVSALILAPPLIAALLVAESISKIALWVRTDVHGPAGRDGRE